MRIRTRTLDRKSETIEVAPKLFVMLEGVDTEPLYFSSFFDKNKDVVYLPFERDDSDLGWSNPKLLMDQILLELNPATINSLTYSEFTPFIVRHLRNKDTELDVSAFKRLFNNKLTSRGIKLKRDCIKVEVINSVLEELKELSFIDIVYNNFDDVIGSFNHFVEDKSYSSEIDKIALIVDRDKESFSEQQYEYVVQKSIENNIDFYVTNPCFEFFLALHLSDLLNIERSLFLENKKEDDKTFAHRTLLDLDSSFDKEEYDVEKYISNIPTVLENLKYYESDINKLKNSVGSNLSTLLIKYKEF